MPGDRLRRVYNDEINIVVEYDDLYGTLYYVEKDGGVRKTLDWRMVPDSVNYEFVSRGKKPRSRRAPRRRFPSSWPD